MAFAFADYGEKTASKFCSYFEVQYCNNYDKPVIPLKLYKGAWPPAPPGDTHGTAQNKFFFGPDKVYQEFLEPFDSNALDSIASFVHETAAKLTHNSGEENEGEDSTANSDQQVFDL